MQIQSRNYSPNFQAKIILADERIQKFVKSSFMTGTKDTFETLDKLSEIYPDTIVSIGIKNINNDNYLVAKNGVTGATEKKFLHDTEIIKLEDHSVFIDLVKRIMNRKSFWSKTSRSAEFDATSYAPGIEHDVFNLNK